MWGSGQEYTIIHDDQVYRYDASNQSLISLGFTQTGLALNAIWGRSTDELYVAGSGGAVWRYNGTDWSTMATGNSNEFTAVWASPNKVYTVGNQGLLAIHNGATWTFETISADNLIQVTGSSDTDIYALDDKGIIYHFDGNTWGELDTGYPTARFTQLWVDSSGMALAVDTDGHLYRRAP